MNSPLARIGSRSANPNKVVAFTLVGNGGNGDKLRSICYHGTWWDVAAAYQDSFLELLRDRVDFNGFVQVGGPQDNEYGARTWAFLPEAVSLVPKSHHVGATLDMSDRSLVGVGEEFVERVAPDFAPAAQPA